MSGIHLRITVDPPHVDQSVKNDLTLKLTAEGKSVSGALPLKQPLELEIQHATSNVRASFLCNGNEIASGYLPIDPHCETNPSHVFTDQLVCLVKNIYVPQSKFIADFTLEAHNSRPKLPISTTKVDASEIPLGTTKTGSPLRSTYKGTGQLLSGGETSPLRERVSPTHPRKDDKTFKYKEEELHGYLKRIVDHHI